MRESCGVAHGDLEFRVLLPLSLSAGITFINTFYVSEMCKIIWVQEGQLEKQYKITKDKYFSINHFSNEALFGFFPV